MKGSEEKFFRLGTATAACVLALCGVVFKASFPRASAEEAKTYFTRTNIAQQGDNGFYYAWGTPENYVLMTYGVTSGGGEGWRGLEIYSTVSGSSLHPGNYWGVMVVWVADESGKVVLSGEMEKGTTQGDGVTLGVYHQHYGKELDTLFEKFTDGSDNLKYPIEKAIEVSRGDSFVFYCDSGKGKDNSNDSSGCPFTITYTQTAGDKVEGEDLSVYLRAGRASAVGGFQHIEQTFAAENLDGTLTQKITYEGGCSSSVSMIAFAPVALAIPVASVRRKRK